MQTFLPYMSSVSSALALDNKRLGKQRVEAKQILDLIEGRSRNNWINHPAVRMWRRFYHSLKYYTNTMIQEWKSRGMSNTMELYPVEDANGRFFAPWLLDRRLRYSHRANLVRKLPDFYGPKWPDVDPTTPYWWPVELKSKKMQEYLNDFWGWHRCVPPAISCYEDHIILEERNERTNNPSWNCSNN